MQIGALVSGGKDSIYATYVALSQAWEIACLVTMLPSTDSSYMFHFPNVKMTWLQAAAMDLPLIRGRTRGEKEKELNELNATLDDAKQQYDLDGIVSGAIASEYQRTRIDRICDQLGLRSFTPLWHKDPEKLLREEITSGFEIIVSSVSAQGLTSDWLGRQIDEHAVDDLKQLNLKYGVHIAFEGGEGETLVLDCPLFKKRIQVMESNRIWKGNAGVYEIGRARLSEKKTKVG